MESIAVLGPGGVGGFLAAALDRAGLPVTIVAREETAAHISEHGLHIQSARLGEFTVHPEAVAHVPIEDESVLHDMDTPEDYQRELKRAARGSEAGSADGTE